MQIIIIQATMSIEVIPPYLGVIPIDGGCTLTGLSSQKNLQMQIRQSNQGVMIVKAFALVFFTGT